MPKYINVGVFNDLRPVPTKKELKRLAKEDPNGLSFYATSDHTPSNYLAEDVPPGIVLVVVGPDPYNNRKWYANVTREHGKLVVK